MQGLWKSKLKYFEKDKRNLIKKEIYKNSFNEIKQDKEYELTISEKYFRKRIYLCNILYDNKEINAYTFELSNKSIFYLEKNIQKIKNTNIKILHILDVFEEENIIKEEIYKIFNNEKYFFKNKKLKNYKYELFFNRYYFYGSYSERININRRKTKQMLKNFENNNLDLLEIKYKYQNIYG